jgi:hypothetical protein
MMLKQPSTNKAVFFTAHWQIDRMAFFFLRERLADKFLSKWL